ncbi:MAG: UDP-N-acetylmuramoyl-tripeptide--D-alanyl-D-alanine ligase, partial [Cocleimonas sp.]|nr:UDP-N-acetylmuramoyl-tripeptide--D-alanyl-D-alanine ligase [Cocleimonas sp.]
TVKEMLAAILSCKGKVMATFGNLNNEIGVPLTLLRLRDDDYAVVEMGANHFGEIDYLTQITRPDVAILNNAGAAHLEGFGDVKGVSRAKAEIFRGLTLEGIAVINRDDDYADYWISCNSNRDVIRFGFSEQADVKASVSDAESDDRLLLTVGTESLSILLCLQGHHNKMNALAASAAALAIGIDLQTIKQGLENLRPVKGRLAPKKGIKGIEIIDDTYNANPDSARVAVDVLSRKKTAKRILVLGDMGELGDNTAQLHADIGVYAKQQGIDKLYCLGHYSQQAAEKFEEGAYSFNEIKPLLDCLKQELESSMTVLVKGSRAMKMERIVEALSNQNVIPQEVVKCS